MNLNFEYFIGQNKFKRIGLKAVMLIERPLLTNHICSNYALKIVIQSALIPTSACSTTKQPSVATGSLDAWPLNYASWAIVPASKALPRFPANWCTGSSRGWSGWDWRGRGGSHWVWCWRWSCHRCWSWSLICWSVQSRWRRHKVELLLQKLFFAPCISTNCRRAWLLLLLGLVVQGQLLWVKGESKARSQSEGELESIALAIQRLAEFQALGCQVSLTHCSHFWILLN